MKLNDAKLRKLVAPGRYFDGGGLYLEVTPAGGRYWRLKYRHGGKEKRAAFGVYPEVTLKAARDQRDEARKLLAAGLDPAEVRKANKAQAEREANTTFQAVGEKWLKHRAGKWGPATAARIASAFRADVYPSLGTRPMAQIKPRDVAQVVKAIEARGAGEMAGRVLQRIRAVYRYAVVHEVIDTNPMLDLMPGELLKPRRVTHRAALPENEVPSLLRKLRTYPGDPITVWALRLLMLTALRPGELRGLRWDEVDMKAAEIRIPAARMKMGAPHAVPLSRQALEVLAALRPLTGGQVLVLPSPYYPGKSLSDSTLNSALARMGFKGVATAHGMRALFSTVSNEAGYDADAIERQLSHQPRDMVRAAYHRATYMQDRAKLMQFWADWIDAKAQEETPDDPPANNGRSA